ncbi:flagellar motor rotation protein MotB [Filimonas lacunae]|nr:flagellar motor rotation protein MotB [Filimonas lacunae]
MRNLFVAMLVISCTMAQTAQAQFFKKLQQKLEDKANAKADNILNGKKKESTTTSSDENNSSNGVTKGKLPYEEELFTFIPGTKLYYSDSLVNETTGTMPKHWKTHSTGAVTTVPDVPGKWLSMRPRSTYRIDSLLPMPKNFTLEFDLLTRCDKPENLESIRFGFLGDNNAAGYIYGFDNENTSAVTNINYSYNFVNNRSYDTDTNNELKFPLNNFGNRLIHMSVTIEGQHMRVYLDKCKMLDADMFNRTTAKYFFISTDDTDFNKARVYISNLRIAEL